MKWILTSTLVLVGCSGPVDSHPARARGRLEPFGQARP